MNKGLAAAVFGTLFILASSLPAQFLIGPALQAGMTYSKNFIVDDTSKYYIANSPSLFGAGGLDIAYQINDNVRVQVGGQMQYRSFNLKAPDGVEGLSFTNIKKSALVVAVPLAIHYRFPMGDGGNKFVNIIAGHSFDFTFADSSVISTPSTMVDSGQGFTRHEFQIPKSKMPVTSALLGAGMDFQSESGNVLNVSLLWGISTRKLFRGNIREWEVLNQSYDGSNPADPEEFPEHYYDFALRGSNLSLRLSYWFCLKAKKEKEEER